MNAQEEKERRKRKFSRTYLRTTTTLSSSILHQTDLLLPTTASTPSTRGYVRSNPNHSWPLARRIYPNPSNCYNGKQQISDFVLCYVHALRNEYREAQLQVNRREPLSQRLDVNMPDILEIVLQPASRSTSPHPHICVFRLQR